MNTAQPIRKGEDLQRFKEYFQSKSPNKRNYLLVITGLNTALRISDILKLRWGMYMILRGRGIGNTWIF